MSSSIWGATPEEWSQVSGWGIAADLLPVVSNPNAVISPLSKMRDMGKTPSRYNRERKVAGIPDWTNSYSNDNDIVRWQRDSDLGICIQTRLVRAIDIDIEDPAAARIVRDCVELVAGDLPVRWRADSGKCLLAFKLEGQYSKRIIRTERGIIEFLANGQQFVGVGTHPKGERYQWEGGIPDDVPYLTAAEFEVVWAALVKEFAVSNTEVRSPVKPMSQRQADDADDDVLRFLESTGRVLSFDGQGRAHITCPWVHEHTSDSDENDTSTSYFPRGVGGFEQGHFKCLHAHCAERNDGDFLEAIGFVMEDFAVIEADDEPKPLPSFARDRQGRIEATIGNMRMALERSDMTGLAIRYDTFKAGIMIAPDGTEDQWRAFADNDYVTIGERLERVGFKSVPRQLLRDVVAAVAMEAKFDSAQLWMSTLVWDGVPRVERFWSTYFSVVDSGYTRSVGLYTWTALAGRVLEPGCKADMVPILVGGQGVGKSTGVEAMSPHKDFFTEISFTEKDADKSRRLRGKLVAEIGELRGLHTKEMEEIKSFITRTREEWVPKFFEFLSSFDRRVLFIGTTNQEEFLADETGNRRWLPMRVGQVDRAGIDRDCLQLWAEAAWLFEQGGVQYAAAQKLANEEHDAFTMTDPWDDAVSQWLAEENNLDQPGVKNGDVVFTAPEVLESGLGFSTQKITTRELMRVAKILARFGYRKTQFMRNGRNTKGWKRA